MNNFHVYQAIGRGKHSTVYKGRKKKSLEYCAIKSVDKSQRTKVLQEVRALHSLDHPNILKFFHCYETSAHLWLVLEYCVGGDLMTLLRQDQRLPESSVHDLARDVVKALQFLHSKGIIYCDLKPSNILLDENGRVKLCDFGLARPLSDLSKNAVSMLPQTKRGTPCYMAPELFQDGGVHSFASDFWALGCILYECFVGRPPFYGNEFTQLVNSILGDELQPLPNNPSSSFSDLIERLLVKDPSERIQWSELCQHSFWRTKFAPVALPPQPDFNHMLRLYSKTCIPENNDDKSMPQRTPSKCHERSPTDAHKQDENCHSNAVGFTTPTKNAQCLKKTIKTVVRVDDKRKISNAAKNVNILRLSRIANLNLQRENEKENYRRPIPKSSENNVEVKIENNDMELDFSENPEYDAPDETDGPEDACTPDSNVSSHCQTNEADVDVDAHDINRGHSSVLPDGTIELQQDIPSDDKEVTATPPSVNQHRKGHRVKAGIENAPDLDTTKSENNIWQVLWHSSDLSVKPVMPNKKSDKASLTTPMLPFECPAASDYVKLPPEQLEELNGHISHSLGGPSQLSEKQSSLRYVEMLSMNSEAANLLTNGPIMPLLVKMLRLSKTSTLRVQLASVVGLVIRHSTLIKPDLATSGIMNVLTDGLRDKQDKVRRFCMAALGELLFYISTQNDQEGSALESPLKDGRSTSGWQVPSSVVALVCSILRKGEDDTIQLYALRSIENICSQGSEWSSRFSGQNMIGNMCYIYKAIGKQENTRLTAGSCLVRFARFSPSSISMVFERLSFRETASSLIKGNPREQQICLNLLIMAMLGNQTISNFNRHLVSLVEEKQLVPTVVSLIERGTEVLKGKTLIFIALLSKSSRRWLPHFFCNAKLLSAVDRLVKEKDSFIQQCIEFFVQLVASTVPGILETVHGDIQQVMLSKRHGHVSSPAVRANPKNTTHLFPVLHLLGSLCFKHKLVTNQVLSQLANVMTLLVSPFQGRDDFQITFLQVLEIISEDHLLITQEPKIFTSQLLPGLAVLYKGNKDPDARFLCLKVLFDVMIVLFNEFVPATATYDSSIKKDLKAISETHFLPLYPVFVEDEDPIPMYAQKLLVMLIEFNYVEVSDILNMKTVSQCFGFLLGDLSSANVSNVKLCLALASAPEMEAKFLSQMRLVRKIGNLLEFVNAKEMEDFLEPTLGLCKAFILHCVGINRGITYAREPAFLLDKAMDMQFAIMQNNIKDIADFSSNIGVFLELVGHDDPQVADLASECLVVLAKAAPRESTMGFLTNLAKINSVLQSMVGVSEPILLRLLYSLAFSCRNYLSQAMILSISVSDVQRIETIVSSFKGSNSSSIVTAAAVLASELQRLPRYT